MVHLNVNLDMNLNLNRLGRRDGGAVALLSTLLISTVFIGLCALVIDLGMARDTRRQAQNAADASALAAVNVLYLSGVVDANSAIIAAKTYAAANYQISESDWASCVDGQQLLYHPNTECISFDNPLAPTTVRVNAPVRRVRTAFAGIWGIASVPVGAAAQARIFNGGPPPCGLCVLGPGVHNLQNGNVYVTGANIALNGTVSSHPGSLVDVTGGVVNLQGGLSQIAPGTFTSTPNTNQPVVTDPLASMNMPNYSTLLPKANSCTGGPGIYDHLTTCPGLGMLPGLYVLTGASSPNSVVANGVTLYFICGTPTAPRACATGESGASLSMGGNDALTITAPTTGASMGLSMVADRNNTATFAFHGNGTQTNTGTIYLPGGTLQANGNGSNAFDSLVVIGDLAFNGNPATLSSTYTQPANVIRSGSDMHLSD